MYIVMGGGWCHGVATPGRHAGRPRDGGWVRQVERGEPPPPYDLQKLCPPLGLRDSGESPPTRKVYIKSGLPILAQNL